MRFSSAGAFKGLDNRNTVEPLFSEVWRMAQNLLVAVAPHKSAKQVRVIVPNGEPVLDCNGPNDYLCHDCRTVLIRGAEPHAFSAKALILICGCGTHCATDRIEP